MSDLIRTSYESLKVIPDEHKRVLHSMYEDNDLDGAHEAESAIDFIEKEVPGTFVGIMANDSVSPPCAYTEDNHFPCDYYAEEWYTVLVSKKIWDEYKSQVEAKDQEWKDAHQCKLMRYTDKDLLGESDGHSEEFNKEF
jgi:hypothetical protein